MIDRWRVWWRRRRGGKSEDTGQWGERVAARYLRDQGYRILGQRVRPGRRDEIDLVARDGQSLVFVEVKTRASEDFGRPVSAVNRSKRYALSRAAIHYLRHLKYPQVYWRFDVVEVIGKRSEDAPTVRHIENAFPLDSRFRYPGRP